VDGGQRCPVDAQGLIERLQQERKRVGRRRTRRDHSVRASRIRFIDPRYNDALDGFGRQRRENDPPGTGAQMGFHVTAAPIPAGGIDDAIDL
jgi:hypothetical protein